MTTLQNNQLTAANKLQLIKAISNYDFYNDFSELMQDTTETEDEVGLSWYFDTKTNEIILETHKENTWAEYEHGYDNRYAVFCVNFAKGYEQGLFYAFHGVVQNFDMLVSQGKFGRMVRTAQKDMVNLNMVSWILINLVKSI